MRILSVIVLCIVCTYLQAQDNTSQARTEVPKGFKKGMVVMEDNVTLSGYIRENIRSNASLVFIDARDGRKLRLDGTQVRSVMIDSTQFICIKGDFFKVISEGEQSLVQKSSDASGKPVYNGTDAILANGTDGHPGDYFLYNGKQQTLKRLTRN